MIDIQHVSKGFRRGDSVVEALRDFTLTIEKREVVAIIGPSGCGKSTLLNMIAGLYAPSKGRVVYKGQAVTDVNTDVGYMTQKDNLLPWRNVRDNIAFPLELAGVGAWQAFQKLDRPGVFVGRDLGFHEVLQLLDQLLAGREARTRDDIGLDDEATALVRRCHHAALRHGRMLLHVFGKFPRQRQLGAMAKRRGENNRIEPLAA